MTPKLGYLMTLVAVFGLGHLSAGWHEGVAHAQANQAVEKAAYLIVSPGSVQAPACWAPEHPGARYTFWRAPGRMRSGSAF